jgi:hypothetical protein
MNHIEWFDLLRLLNSLGATASFILLGIAYSVRRTEWTRSQMDYWVTLVAGTFLIGLSTLEQIAQDSSFGLRTPATTLLVGWILFLLIWREPFRTNGHR